MVQPTIPKSLQPPSPKILVKPPTVKQQKEIIPTKQLEKEYKKFYGKIPDLSFEEYANKWDSKIGETISIWDPKLSSREKELKLKSQI